MNEKRKPTNWGRFEAQQRASQPREGETQAEAWQRAAGRADETPAERYQRHTRDALSWVLALAVLGLIIGIAAMCVIVGAW